MKLPALIAFVSAATCAWLVWPTESSTTDVAHEPARRARIALHAEHAPSRSDVVVPANQELSSPLDETREVEEADADAELAAARAELAQLVATADADAPPDARTRRHLRDRALRALADLAPHLSPSEHARQHGEVLAQLADLDALAVAHFDD